MLQDFHPPLDISNIHLETFVRRYFSFQALCKTTNRGKGKLAAAWHLFQSHPHYRKWESPWCAKTPRMVKWFGEL